MRREGVSGIIEHDGKVQDVDSNSIVVKIIASPACSGCHAESVCSLSGKKEKFITIGGKFDLKTGDDVTIIMKQSQGLKAVMLGYVIPFLVLVSCLVILVSLSVSELVAGLASVAVLVPYYLILCFFKDQINQNFTFTIKT